MFTFPVRHLFFLVFACFLFAAETKADVIVTVDVSNLNEVVFTSTEAFAEGSFTGDGGNGITLKDFFTGNTFALPGSLIDSTLSAFGSADQSTQRTLDRVWIASFGGGYTPDDISFYDFFVNPIFSFDNQRALEGSAVFDLTQFGGLPEIGTTGNIYFDVPDQNQIIGQWQIVGVPEPSSAIMVAFGSVLLLRRRR